MAKTSRPVIIWFRQDLRLSDNPALTAACATGAPVIPVYILDDENAGAWKMGAASRVWLHHSLTALNKSLSGALVVRTGDALKILPQLVKETDASAVFWNRCYEPWRIERDKKLKLSLPGVETFNGSLLHEPWTVLKNDGTPYKVFTPFYNACLAKDAPGRPLPSASPPPSPLRGEGLRERGDRYPWEDKVMSHWTPGEAGAQAALKTFLKNATHYAEGRDRPDREHVSRLAPYLHFGEISPRQVWHTVGDKSESFLRELIWRDFAHSLLYHNPAMPSKPLQPSFAEFPWHNDPQGLRRWQRGLTGYPIVDAGMRQLWETGWMHNRVRMIVASFLIKDLLIPWQEGEAWFWDTLVDADLANNSMNWQWVAGCGADAAPFFRIFNPVTQGQKFDPDGAYVRRWVPELKNVPTAFIHEPWKAPDKAPESVYPSPMVDHKAARERALAALKSIKA